MKKENMLTYLERQLEKNLGEYDFGIDWDTKNHTIEIIIRLYAQNEESEAITDLEGVVSEEEIIEFEDGLLFYHPEKSMVDKDDFLATFPYEGKKGVSKKLINSLAIYLREVLDQGQSDLLDFLSDTEMEIFELVWDNDAFEKVLQNTKDTNEYVAYPSY